MTAQLTLDFAPTAPPAPKPSRQSAIDWLLAECRRVRPDIHEPRTQRVWSVEKHPVTKVDCACWLASDCGVLVYGVSLLLFIAEAWTGGQCADRGEGGCVESALRDLACYRPSFSKEG